MNDGRRGRRLAGAVALAVFMVIVAASAQAAPRGAGEDAAAALPASEWTTIQRIIGDQLAALRSGDAVRAFSFASPGIRDPL